MAGQAISAAFIEQYSANVQHLAQQSNSRFSGKVRMETQAGKSKFYEQVGPTAAVKITARNSDTPNILQDLQRRATFLNQYVWGTLTDRLDLVEVLIDPNSAFMQNAMMAFNRAKDSEVIAAATGTAYADTGSGNGTVAPVTFPAGQQIAVNYIDPGTSSGANTGLTLAKLVRSKSILGQAEYPEGSKLYFAYKQQQLDDLLLNVSQVASTFTSDVKALQIGEVNSFVGMEFIKTQLLSTTSNVTTNFAYVESALLLAIGQDARGRMSERADKNYANQVFMDMSIGATRMQEPLVVSVAVDDTK
jgi:hypothetical protein